MIKSNITHNIPYNNPHQFYESTKNIQRILLNQSLYKEKYNPQKTTKLTKTTPYYIEPQ